MSFNVVDYYKGTVIYQHCSPPNKYIPYNTLYLHLLFLYFVLFSRLSLTQRGRFDFQMAFAMFAFGRKRAVASAETSLAVGQYYHTNTRGPD